METSKQCGWTQLGIVGHRMLPPRACTWRVILHWSSNLGDPIQSIKLFSNWVKSSKNLSPRVAHDVNNNGSQSCPTFVGVNLSTSSLSAQSPSFISQHWYNSCYWFAIISSLHCATIPSYSWLPWVPTHPQWPQKGTCNPFVVLCVILPPWELSGPSLCLFWVSFVSTTCIY